MEEQDAEAVEIALGRRRCAGQYLGREIHRRAGNTGRIGTLRTAGAEVHQNDSSAFLAHDVLRFDVAVHESLMVYRGERPTQIDADRRSFAAAEWTMRAEPGLQRLPVHQLHPEPCTPIADVGAVDGDHVRVAHLRQRAGFAKQTIDGSEQRDVAA